MKTRLNQKTMLSGAFVLLALLIASCSQNWPQFRGPENNMLIRSKNLPGTWSSTENIRWTHEIEGDSWTSPIVWGNKIFYTTAIPIKVSPEPERQAPRPPRPQAEAAANSGNSQNPPAPPQRPDPREDKSYLEEVYRWEVCCVDLESGQTLWKTVAKEGSPGSKKHRATNYASETPITDGKRLYAYFGMNGLYCYDLDGTLLWEKDLGTYSFRLMGNLFTPIGRDEYFHDIWMGRINPPEKLQAIHTGQFVISDDDVIVLFPESFHSLFGSLKCQ